MTYLYYALLFSCSYSISHCFSIFLLPFDFKRTCTVLLCCEQHSEESYGGKYKTEGMNEIYARRLAQTMTFHQLMRSHGTLWAATQVTKEKLDLSFVKEELMRVNGRRAMPLLIGAAAEENLNDAHLVHLTEHCAWAESARAFAVQRQTPLTQHIAAMGRMSETINQSKAASSVQTLFNEHLSRIEGIATFEEEPVFEEENFH